MKPPHPIGTPIWQRLIGPYAKTHPSGLLDDDGGVPSPRPKARHDLSCGVPFGFTPERMSSAPLACIIHAFYPDVLPALLPLIANIPRAVDLLLSTDTEEKRAEIAGHCAGFTKGGVEIRLAPNRGRDIAPKLIAFRDVYERYDLFLHLHTKRSLHADKLASWGDYLTATLLGSPEIAGSILALFDDPNMGIVFPQHLFRLRRSLRWGHNYDHARRLLARMGVTLQADWPLDFPSGSMFFGRSAALKPLLDLDLDFEDFSQEAGQVDGTPAHAIERIILHVAEHAGYEWLKVARADLYPLPRTVLAVPGAASLTEVKRRLHAPCLPLRPPPVIEAAPPGSVILHLPEREASARLIAIETPAEHRAALYKGLSLWQRRDPVEAARWPILLGAAAFSAATMPRNMIRTLMAPEQQTMRMLLGWDQSTTGPFAAIVSNGNDPAAWADAIAGVIEAMKRI